MQQEILSSQRRSRLSAYFGDSQLHSVPRMLDRVIFVCALLALAVGYSEFFIVGLRPLNLLVLFISTVSLLSSRRYIWPSALGAMASVIISALCGLDPILLWTVMVFIVFSATMRGTNVFGISALAVFSSFSGAIIAYGFKSSTHEALVFVAVVLGIAGTGSSIYSYFRYRDEQARRLRDAGMKRVAEINRRVADERLQIARDLHDVVGHEIAMLGIHLGVAEVNTPSEATQAQESLAAARANVQSVLAETQQILHVLRSNESSVQAPGMPTPSLSGIEDLIKSVQSAGLKVQAQLATLPEDLNPEVSTAAYRIAQEALTNAQRHGVEPVQVGTRVDSGHLIITIANDKSAQHPKSEGSGLGLVGMKERTESAGGTLQIKDTAQTFKITATLPLAGGTN